MPKKESGSGAGAVVLAALAGAATVIWQLGRKKEAEAAPPTAPTAHLAVVPGSFTVS